MAKRRKLLKKAAVRMVSVPSYKELAVSKIWAEVKDDPELKLYFCEEYSDGKYPARDYFFNVLNTGYPDYLASLIKHAHEQRNGASGEGNAMEVIEIADEWMEELKSFPFRSRKFIGLIF